MNANSKQIRNSKPKNALVRVEIRASVLTFPYWDNAKYKAITLTMCTVIDCYTGKIIGFSSGRRENAMLYIKALKVAFNGSKVLPFELVNRIKNEVNDILNRIVVLKSKGLVSKPIKIEWLRHHPSGTVKVFSTRLTSRRLNCNGRNLIKPPKLG